MAEVKNVQPIGKERYLRLLEDSAILRQIEFLLESGCTSDMFMDSVKDILAEMRMSRLDNKK